MAEGFKPQRPPSLILAKGFRNETLTPSLHQNPDLGIISPRHIVRSVIGKLSVHMCMYCMGHAASSWTRATEATRTRYIFVTPSKSCCRWLASLSPHEG